MLLLNQWTKIGRAANHRHLVQRLTGRGYSKTAAISTPKKTVLIVGSNGVLGSTLSQHLKEEYDCHTIGADVTDSNTPPSLDSFLLVSANDIQDSLHSSLPSHLPTNTSGTPAIDAIICTNGGYSTDDPSNPTSTHTQMMNANYRPVIAASSLLPAFLTPHNGLFIATGASAALAPSPPPLTAYGCSKAAVHHFIHSLGAGSGLAMDGSRVQRRSVDAVRHRRNNPYLDTLTVVGVLPSVIDTPYNRKGITSEKEAREARLWTPPMDIAREIGRWVHRTELRPHSGSLVKVLTRKTGSVIGEEDSYETEFHLVR